MKIIIEDLPQGEEEQIVIRCNEIRPELLGLVENLKTQKKSMLGYDGDEIHMIQPGDIYYYDTVDNKVFMYCHQKVLESKSKLYEIEDELANADFLRVSKSVLLNLNKIERLRPAFSGRFEAALSNGEIIIISRQYVSSLKKKLGM